MSEVIMKNVIHFDSPQERLAFLKGKYEEITPVEAKIEEKTSKNEDLNADFAKKSQKTTSKRKKTSKKVKKDGEIQAE